MMGHSNVSNQYINLSMSSLPQEGSLRRRTSQRMRLKILRNLDQYKILNPYKQSLSPSLPPQLDKQLKKLTHLSTTVIRLLSLPVPPHLEHNLLQMEHAYHEQQSRFRQVIGDSTYCFPNPLKEEMEGECESQAHPTHPSLGSAGVQSKDDFHLHLLEERSNLHLPDDRLNLHDNLFESRSHQPASEDNAVDETPLVLQDFEQYFDS